MSTADADNPIHPAFFLLRRVDAVVRRTTPKVLSPRGKQGMTWSWRESMTSSWDENPAESLE